MSKFEDCIKQQSKKLQAILGDEFEQVSENIVNGLMADQVDLIKSTVATQAAKALNPCSDTAGLDHSPSANEVG